MRKLILPVFLMLSAAGFAQSDTTKLFRAFPVTDYMVSLDDTTKLVQLEMPEGITLKDKQLGIVYGIYRSSREDAVQKGYGRCHLIKGQYYYFAISNNKSGLDYIKDDLLYVTMDKPSVYMGRYPKLAAHFIRLLDVSDTAFYDRYLIFNKWNADDERQLTESIVKDIQFTGDYFLQNDPSMNQQLNSGDYAGKKLLEVMSLCKREDLEDFLDYMIARPRLYAGKEWKISEIFATWLSSGAPKVVK